jgi:hypothetical protein
MANPTDGNPSPLPDELVAALQRATDLALNAILSLRIAVRDHVRNERTLGSTGRQIDTELRSMILVAGGDTSHRDYSTERIEEMTSQVLKWSREFYARQT